MDYIVFDLEWNQSPKGKKYSNKLLPFEIIEIGAVKVDENFHLLDSFHCLIKPKVYSWINENIREVVHLNIRDLRKGIPFPEAAEAFFEWCGDDFILCSWGTQDVMELQRNMKYYHQMDLLTGPVKYYDIQKLYSLRFGEKPIRRSLEFAIDALDIQKDHAFHRALEDAIYTARVLIRIADDSVLPYFSIDTYQIPESRKDEVHVSYPTYDKYISRSFETREKMIKDREVNSTRCPLCCIPAKRKIRWFADNNNKNYYSLSICAEHGIVKGKVRVRKAQAGGVYAIKTIRLVNDEDALGLIDRKEAIRLKKKARKNNKEAES